MTAQTPAISIAIVTDHFPRRSETFVLDQVMHLHRLGFRVKVLCRERGDLSLLDAADRADIDGVEVHRLPGPPRWLRHLRPWRLRQRLARRRDRTALAALDADLVLAHFGNNGALVADLMDDTRPWPPLVIVYHGRDIAVDWAENRLARYQRQFRVGALHLPVNGPFADMLVQAGAPAERVCTLHLGLQIRKFTYRPPDRGAVLHLVSICRFVEKKGIAVAIAALARLRADRPDLNWRYDIGGEGDDAPKLLALVEEYGLAAHVRFLGPLRHDETLALVGQADVLLQPSVIAGDGDQEGIPIILMEAMAMGTIVCSTRHSGIPELVEHDVSGLLSEEYDATGLAANLRRIAEGHVDLAAMAIAARRRIETDFDADTQIHILAGYCSDLVRPAQQRVE